MDRQRTWLEATEALGSPLILEAVIAEAGRVHFVGDLPEGFRFLRGDFVDLGFEHYPAPADIRGVALAILGTGILVPDTHYRLRSHHGGHTCVEPADGGETATLPRDWKQFVVVIGNDDRWSWVGKRVTPGQTGGVDLSMYQDDGDGWTLLDEQSQSDTIKLLTEISDAYEALGLRPVRRHFFIPDQGGDLACPLVALALRHGVTDRDDPDLARDDGFNLAVEWAAQQFGEGWMIGFLDGFDGDPQHRVDAAYLDGASFGAMVAEQLGVVG